MVNCSHSQRKSSERSGPRHPAAGAAGGDGRPRRSSWRILRGVEEGVDPDKNLIVRGVRKIFPVAGRFHGHHWFVNLDGNAIVNRGGPPAGAHSDIFHPELVWAGLAAAGLVAGA